MPERSDRRQLTDPELLGIYASWADELRSKYQRVSGLFRHGPSIGRSREVYLADALKRCIPASLDVCHGAFYIPGYGASSEQDILVIDRAKHAPIEEVGDFGVYFRDSVRACIEVKSRLTKREMTRGVNSLVQTRKLGPGMGTRYVLFAYDTHLSADVLLAAIDNSEDFIDFRPHLMVVLGKLVIAMTDFDGQKPRPRFTFTAFSPKPGAPDLTMMELIDTIMALDVPIPFRGLREEIRGHFVSVASRTFVCPVDRPGAGTGTNLETGVA